MNVLLTIYKFNSNDARYTVDADVNSDQSGALMGEDIITLNFSAAINIPFRIGDYCNFFGKNYQVNTLPKVTKVAVGNISYTLVLESELYDLGKVQFLFQDQNNNFTSPIYPAFRGTPRDFGDLIILNLQRIYPKAGWKLGYVIEADFLNQPFTAPQNCLEVLKTVSDIFQTEYIIENKTINIYQRQTSSGIVIRYGKDQAALTITKQNQNNANLITRLYAFGSTKNITNSYRSGSPNLRMGNTDFVEKNISTYGIFEQTVVFDGTTKDRNNAPLPEIYPHRTGTITATEPNTTTDYFLYLYDTAIDFNFNLFKISGVTAQITFNTGLLAGVTFDINSYDNTLKRFLVNQNTSNPNLIMPTAAFAPQVGDTYVITNITMPPSYIAAAEAQLRTAALNYISKNCIPAVMYDVSCNAKYFKDFNIQFSLGQSVTVIDEELGINVSTRITAFTRNIRNPYLYTLQLANTVPAKSIIVKLINGL